jgi:leucyl aminopeptidase
MGEGQAALPAALGQSDRRLDGALTRLVESGEFRARAQIHSLQVQPETHLLHTMGRIEPERILLVAAGPSFAGPAESLRVFAARAVQAATDAQLSRLSLLLPESPVEAELRAQSLVEGLLLGAYRFDRYRVKEGRAAIEQVTLLLPEAAFLSAAQRGVQSGQVVAHAAVFARDLANTPPNECTPATLAQTARELAQRLRLHCTVLERADMEKMGMGGLVAVSGGSAEPPKLILLEYKGSADPPIVLVGKAVTFDAGGISLKPWAGMDDMKFDKCGGVAVLAALQAVAALELPLHVVGIIPAVENLPSGTAYRPGDVVRLYGGKSAEILSTDAEGRMILADALAYAVEQKPQAIIDAATLTGACVVALGTMASGLFGNHDGLLRRLQAAGELSGERVWPFPLWPEYGELIKSEVADIKNAWGRSPGPAGAIMGAWFLREFVGNVPWAHLDIAGTAWVQDGTLRRPHIRSGATGTPVRLLVQLLRDWKSLDLRA